MAISCKDLFFLSITPFLLRCSKRREIMRNVIFITKFFQRMIFKFTTMVGSDGGNAKAFSFWILFEKILKASQASFLWIRNITQVNMEKSSPMTRSYFLPSRLVVLVGPKRSICKSLSDLVVETTFLLWKVLLVYLSLWQYSQVKSLTKLILIKPLTSSFWEISEINFRWAWSSFLCHNHFSSTKDAKHFTFWFRRLCRYMHKYYHAS